MINLNEVFETNKMIHEMNLDVRTITIGISLLDCVGATLEEVKENIYNKITTVAKDLVKTGKDIENEFGIPIVNNVFLEDDEVTAHFRIGIFREQVVGKTNR